ncbi:MAG: hypothetical protein Q8O67_10825 [Deltaproteobacteria bacterium]|nr:hypothetical protein [Deltaproteobacteria bacterium]
MAISMNPASLAAVTGFLKQAGMAMDPSSSLGVKVSVEEAQNLKKAFDAIPDPEAKKVVGAALLKLIQSDVFEVPSKTARDVIAKVVGQPADQVFSARAKAELVGGASIKNLATMAMGLLAKVPNLDKAQVEKLTKGLEGLPKEVKNLAYAVLNNSSKEGEVKFGDGARPAFTKGYAKAEGESEGAVSKMAESFTEPASGSMEYFASVMANSPYFEDRLAALMFMVCAKGMKEVDDSMNALDNDVKNDIKKNDKKPKTPGAKGTVSGGATGQTGQITKGDATKPTTTTGQLRNSYEALVQSAASQRADGVITEKEATNLVKKLDGLSPPEAKKLQAEAMGRALLAGGGGELTPEMKPLADWVEKTTGKPLKDCGDAKALYEATTPLAQTIGGSDKLENKVAAFILEGVFGEGKGPKMAAVMGEMKPLFQAMEKEVTGKTSSEISAEQPKTSQHSQNLEDRFTGLANAVRGGKVPVADLTKAAATMIDRSPVPIADKKALFDGVTAGLTAIANDKNLDIKAAYGKAVGPLVEAVKKDSPEVDAVVGGAVDNLKNRLAGVIFDTNDTSPQPMSKEAVQKLLDTEQPKAKAKLMEEAKAKGFDAPALDALSTSFDHEAKSLHAEVQKTGTLLASEPRGQGTDQVDPTSTDQSRSRQVMFEKVKLQMNRLSEMMQAMSNILNTLHQTAENAIRAIR